MRLIACILVVVLCFHTSHCRRRMEISRLNFFDIDLLRYLAEGRSGNVVVSPASIKSTLSMILEGATGQTADEIRRALRLSPYKDDFQNQLNLYLSGLRMVNPGATLQNANAMFMSNRLHLMKNYENALKNTFYSDVFTSDFNNPEQVANQINQWVNMKTHGLIPAIIGKDNIDTLSDVVLTNALYFKSSWMKAFNVEDTFKACFRLHGGCRHVAMMYLQAELKYAYVDNLRAHAVELPYAAGSNYSMILVIPDEVEGVGSLIRDLPYVGLPHISEQLELTDVELFLPKFDVEYSEDMVETLKEMQIKTLFTKNATLNGMFEGVNAYELSHIFHKVHLSVDEKGTVAAAATSAGVIPLIGSNMKISVDRPFLFFIRDNSLGLVLFEGKIEEPNVFEDKFTERMGTTTALPPTPVVKVKDSFSRLFG